MLGERASHHWAFWTARPEVHLMGYARCSLPEAFPLGHIGRYQTEEMLRENVAALLTE